MDNMKQNMNGINTDERQHQTMRSWLLQVLGSLVESKQGEPDM